ncbi:MAG: hypothetical protein ACRDQ7_21625 [Haloechinothrix sp.]
MRPAHRVLLVGPWRSSAASGGCCGADVATLAEHDHAEQDGVERYERVAAVEVVRALRAVVDISVDVELVDPRNTAFMLPAVYRDARRSGFGMRAAVTEAVRATTPWALVIDGKVVSRAGPLTPAIAIALLPAELKYS